MRRRTCLRTAVGLVISGLAGCSSSSGTAVFGGETVPSTLLVMTSLPTAELPSRVLYSVQKAGNSHSQLISEILDGGATIDAIHLPLPTDKPVVYGDGIYELSATVREQVPATVFSVMVDIVTDSLEEQQAVQFSSLPAVDREKLAANGLADGDVIGVGTSVHYTESGQKRSALVPESPYSYIVWEHGAEAEWRVYRSYDVTQKTYQYSSEQVTTASEYGQRMRERFEFELSDLPDGERTILETAVEERQYVPEQAGSIPAAFESLADRFRGHEPARALDEPDPDSPSGRYLVRYEGETYWTLFSLPRQSRADGT